MPPGNGETITYRDRVQLPRQTIIDQAIKATKEFTLGNTGVVGFMYYASKVNGVLKTYLQEISRENWGNMEVEDEEVAFLKSYDVQIFELRAAELPIVRNTTMHVADRLTIVEANQDTIARKALVSTTADCLSPRDI
ncbi:MAG: hypothetical protein Q9165_005015, partial [Trypethelium subeluteriae]